MGELININFLSPSALGLRSTTTSPSRIERIAAGIEKKSRVPGKEERRRVAYHEMGHALAQATRLRLQF